jgi:hypothetical protein
MDPLLWPLEALSSQKLPLNELTMGGHSVWIARYRTKSRGVKSLNKQTPWPLVRKRNLPTKRPPLVGEIYCQHLRREWCCVVSAADPLRSLISVFFRPELLPSFQVAPHLFSGGWLDPVPDSLLRRKFGSSWNRTQGFRVSSQEL